jgi:hypothetical protein
MDHEYLRTHAECILIFASFDCHGTYQMGSKALIFAVLAAFSLVAKRRSARPGGLIYEYNRGIARKHFSDRRREIRDMLNDPLLARDVERRYGDVSSLREWVERWEGDDFAPLKNEGGDDSIKVGGNYLFLWITVANKWLSVLSVVALTFIYISWAKWILFVSLMHIYDNRLLQRAAITRYRKKSGERGIIVAVGVPVPDVEVGIPVACGEVN